MRSRRMAQWRDPRIPSLPLLVSRCHTRIDRPNATKVVTANPSQPATKTHRPRTSTVLRIRHSHKIAARGHMNFDSTNIRKPAPKRLFPEPGALALVGAVLVGTGLFGLIKA